MRGDGASLASYRLEPGQGPSLLSFRASIDSGRLQVAAAALDDLVHRVGITPGPVLITRGHESPAEVEVVVSEARDSGRSRWQHLQARIQDGVLSLSVNGHPLLSVDLGDRTSAASPAFALSPDGAAAFDDVQLPSFR